MREPAWMKYSIMARRGSAGKRSGTHHILTEAKQGKFHYVYGPYAEPVLEIEPGDSISVETLDAFGGVLKSKRDKPSKKLKFPYLNPQSGPIHVKGANKGDCLAVHIRAVETRGPQPAGTTCLVPEFGGLVSTSATAMLHSPLPERVKKMRIDKAGVALERKDRASV
jgi:amidase